MRKPRPLRAGDRLAVVSPASPFPRDEFEAGVEELRALGFVPVWDEGVFAVAGFVSGTADHRARAIRSCWEEPSIAGLIGVRGGYGSIQVLPWLDTAAARLTAKPFIGYSDLTAILTFLTVRAGLVAFHGPTVAGRLYRGAEGYDRTSFLAALTEPAPMGALSPPGLETLHKGEAAGLLLGGNLTQLLASIGTPFAFDPPAGTVLFLEDVGERPYRLDRMITQLRMCGLLRKASAIVLGEFPGCDEPSGQPTARAALADVLADFPGPVIFGFPSGHTTGPAWTLPLGVRARAVAAGTPRLIIEEAAVQG